MKLSEMPLPKGKPLDERVRSNVFDRCTVPWCPREKVGGTGFCEVCQPGEVPPEPTGQNTDTIHDEKSS